MVSQFCESYLIARDTSIISYSKPTKPVPVRLTYNLTDVSENHNEDTDEEFKFIQVYLRIRGDTASYDDLYENDYNTLICKVPKSSSTSRNLKYGERMKGSYEFTRIFGRESNQQEIFKSVVQAEILSFINGKNSTLFTYGASGSGKTYTIVGTPREPGLIPRALEYIFRSIPKLKSTPKFRLLPNGQTEILDRKMLKDEIAYKSSIIHASFMDHAAHERTYKQMQQRLSSDPVATVKETSEVSVSIWVSFTEIYNEKIYDLLTLTDLNKPRPKLGIGKTADYVTYIKNLTHVNVSSGLEAYQVLQFGLNNLNYASTAINSHSSRSHCIFTIKLVQASEIKKEVCISNFNFCDLAGAEKLKKTGNRGDRLIESNNINTSLLVLGKCIENIRKCQKNKDKNLVPFRESKLTQIFERALMGNERVQMIVNINPSRDMFDETLHVLNFSALAKQIHIEEVQRKPNRFSVMMDNKFNKLKGNNIDVIKLQRENQYLQQQLKTRETLVKPCENCENLEQAIEKIIDERDNVIAELNNTILEEKECVARLYKDLIKRRDEIYQETIARNEREHKEEIARLKERLDIIVISSSDEDESPSTSKKDLASMYKDLELRNLEMISKYNILEADYQELKKKNESNEQLLEEAIEECSHLRQENERLKEYRQAYLVNKSLEPSLLYNDDSEESDNDSIVNRFPPIRDLFQNKENIEETTLLQNYDNQNDQNRLTQNYGYGKHFTESHENTSEEKRLTQNLDEEKLFKEIHENSSEEKRLTQIVGEEKRFTESYENRSEIADQSENDHTLGLTKL